MTEPGPGPQPLGERDLDRYVEAYRDLPFEAEQARVRRRRVLERVAAHAPRRLLEVGCGFDPLFTSLPDTPCTVIEPAADFAAHARRLAADRPDVEVVERPAEQVGPDDVGVFDVVLLSALLHEVDDPSALLTAGRRLCAPGGVVHVGVPSAGSLHRRLGAAMGVIADPSDISATQHRLQQPRVYDPATLEAEVAACGLQVVARGGILVKPFTHEQMDRLRRIGFLDDVMLDGLDALAQSMPELGSEIWVEAIATPATAT